MANSNNTSNINNIDRLRLSYIKKYTQQRVNGKRIMRYVGKIDADDIPEEVLNSLKKHIKGTEKLIEYHQFEMTDTNAIYINQWRLV